MLLTRQNPHGGPALKGYPIKEDRDTGVWGYNLGYCGCGCGAEVLMRTVDASAVLNYFKLNQDEFEEWKRTLGHRRKIPWRNRIIRFLGGTPD